MEFKAKLMEKVATAAKDPARQLLVKIAACAKSKGKKQTVASRKMPKTAAERARALYKNAGAANDAFASMVSPVHILASPVGSIAGFIKGKPTEEELRYMDEHPGRSYIPGVGAYRLARKNLNTVKNDSPRMTAVTEGIGTGLAPAALQLIAAGIGASIGGITSDDPALGSAIGGMIGTGIGTAANIGGSLIGTLRKRRTAKEQEEADKNYSYAKALLIPGYAAYQSARRSPTLIREEDERNAKAERERKSK